MFNGCSELRYLNFRSAKLSTDFIELISNLTSNILICLNNELNQNFLLEEQRINCHNNDNNIISNNNVTELRCYMNNSLMENNTKFICEICGHNYFMKYNNSKEANNIYINYYETPKGYYLDENYYFYKLCYNYCKTCNINGNDTHHNCIECNDNYNYESNISNYKNCYLNNPNGIITDTIINTFKSEITNSIIDNNSQLISIDTIINTYKETNTNNKQKKENRREIIEDSINDIFNELNITDIDNGKDKKIAEKDLTIILTSTHNQKNNEDKNNITMNLGQCEDILKKEYNISNNDSLYILQIISEEEGMKIPKIEYEVYYPLNNSNKLTKLDLTLCKDTKIEISIVVNINGSLDKYNSSSDYYNDICSKTTSESGTDISLKD